MIKRLLYIALFILLTVSVGWSATYYAYPTSCAGSETGNGLAYNTPWTSMATINAYSFSEGDDLYFENSTNLTLTSDACRLVVDWEGNSGNRAIVGCYDNGDSDVDDCTITPLVDGGRPTFDGNDIYPSAEQGIISASNQDYVTIQDIKVIDSNDFGILMLRGDYPIIDNCYLTGNEDTSILFSGSSGDGIQYGTISNNYAADQAQHGHIVVIGVNTDNATRYNTINNNRVVGGGGATEGIGCNKKANDNIIEYNEVYDVNNPQIYVDAGKRNTIRYNLLYQSSNFTASNAWGVGIQNEDERGYSFSADNKIYGNLFAGFEFTGIALQCQYQATDPNAYCQDGTLIYNNTFVDCRYSFFFTQSHVNDNISIINNISYHTANTGQEHANTDTPAGLDVVDNNLFNTTDDAAPTDTAGNIGEGRVVRNSTPDLERSSTFYNVAPGTFDGTEFRSSSGSGSAVGVGVSIATAYNRRITDSDFNGPGAITVTDEAVTGDWDIGAWMYDEGGGSGDQTAASCSASDIQSAIDTSITNGGGVITIPACDYTNSWGAADDIVVNTNTPFYIRGSGSGTTKIGYSNSVTHSGWMWEFIGSGFKELSGIYLEGNNSATTYAVGGWIKIYSTGGAAGPTDAIIHDVETKYFDARSTFCHTNNLVVYDNTFGQILDGNDYQFDVYDLANVDWEADGISFPTDFGTNNFNVFFEDNTIYGSHHTVSTFVRAKVVFRYNSVIIDPDQLTGDNQGNLDAHEPGYGTCSSDGITDANSYYHGGQAYEIYNNTFTRTGAEIGQGYAVRIRSGSSIITANSVNNQNDGLTLVLDNNSTGTLCTAGNSYPQDHIIPTDTPSCDSGQGCCDMPDNTYIWGNTYSGNGDNFTTECGGSFVGVCADALAENAEYFLRAPTQVDDGFTWTAYTYPHPLTGESPAATGSNISGNFSIN